MLATRLANNHPHMPARTPPQRPGHRALRLGRISLPHHVYHLTIATYQRRAWFADWRIGRPVARALNDPVLMGDAKTLAWVLMPDHLHWLLRLGEQAQLAEVVRRVKSCSAVEINRLLQRDGPVWMPAFHDHVLRDDEDVRTVARYLAANPLKAGLVDRLADYSLWDAVWLDQVF